MAQTGHVGGGEFPDIVTPGVVGHVGRIVAPGDVRVAAQIFEDVVVRGVPFADDFAVALGAGPQHHRLLKGIGQMRVVGHRFKERMVFDHRPCPAPFIAPVEKPGRRPIIGKHEIAAQGSQPDQVRRVG